MFREMNVIAALAYAAEQAANGHEGAPWPELDDQQRNNHVHRVMAIMRGEHERDEGEDPETFEAVVRAALVGPNGDGHGELALEEIAKLGDFMLNANLLTVEEAQKGGSIVGHAIAFLEQLATIRLMFVPDDQATEQEAAEAQAELEDATVQ